MEFDKAKVYTALNADKLKIGSKVIVADTIDELKQYVEDDCDTSTITYIMPNYFSNRFSSDKKNYNLVYLISEPEPIKCEDLKIGDILSFGDTDFMVLAIRKSEYGSTSVYLPCYEWCTNENLTNFRKKE